MVGQGGNVKASSDLPPVMTGSVTTIVVAVPGARLGTALSCSRAVCPAFVSRTVFICSAGTVKNGDAELRATAVALGVPSVAAGLT